MVSVMSVLRRQLGFYPVMFFLPHHSDHNRLDSTVRAAPNTRRDIISRLRELRSLHLRRSVVLFDIRDGRDPLHALRLGRRGRPHGGGYRVHLAL